jgi:hypothetical protein
VEAPRTLITADMVRPQTPVELEMVVEMLAKLDLGPDWLEWYYEDEADWLNEIGTSYEEWQKLHEQDIAEFLAERAACDAKTA